jgi:hypothetical protein
MQQFYPSIAVHAFDSYFLSNPFKSIFFIFLSTYIFIMVGYNRRRRSYQGLSCKSLHHSPGTNKHPLALRLDPHDYTDVSNLIHIVHLYQMSR